MSPRIVKLARLGCVVVLVALAFGAETSTAQTVPPTTEETGDATGRGATSSYVALTPCRLLDTRAPETDGTFVDIVVIAPELVSGVVTDESGLVGGQTMILDIAGECGVPELATSVAITLTATNTTAPGFLTAFPAGIDRPEVSNLNWNQAGETRANGALAALGSGGQLAVYAMSTTHVVIDVTGAFVPATESASGRFEPVVPRRLVDTRLTRGTFGAAEIIHVERPAEVPADAVAMAVNVTITATTHATFVTGFAHGETPPEASMLNADGAGQTRAATAILPINPGGFDLFNLRGGHLIVDAVGYFTGASAPIDTVGLFVSASPERLVDTRLVDDGSLVEGGAITLAPPKAASASVVATVLNVTLDGNASPGFVTVWPANTVRPDVSSINASIARTTVANLAIVSTSASGFNLFASAATDAVVDLAGWFIGPHLPSRPGAFPVSNLPPLPDAFELPGCSATGRSAVVDKAAQRFWLCEAGTAITDRLRMTSASAAYGLPPIGTYKVFDRDVVGYGREGEKLHRFVTFYTTARGNRIGFHQYVKQDPATIGDLDQRGASDGCLRVSTDDSWTVWDFLRVGDQVNVITN